jgi:hypothetical protein
MPRVAHVAAVAICVVHKWSTDSGAYLAASGPCPLPRHRTGPLQLVPVVCSMPSAVHRADLDDDGADNRVDRRGPTACKSPRRIHPDDVPVRHCGVSMRNPVLRKPRNLALGALAGNSSFACQATVATGGAMPGGHRVAGRHRVALVLNGAATGSAPGRAGARHRSASARVGTRGTRRTSGHRVGTGGGAGEQGRPLGLRQKMAQPCDHPSCRIFTLRCPVDQREGRE